ncbi:hypothetical protein H257_03056 [Aphanomyces astaci]|uniref:Uncharacterized protein n=1 Tax=Aphanomyces astaci TaxID=112090 RepID=W4H1V9_APHAT|nr:hypothetical protein H257_03056 [Aphanomyces astaci]ETV85244.1 hypothetical protein H257_03056 [Aphanomyces astaci]|eukprot:XP_009825262.1 hypothetical protein H257_03056 [Aphanomyces astaci]
MATAEITTPSVIAKPVQPMSFLVGSTPFYVMLVVCIVIFALTILAASWRKLCHRDAATSDNDDVYVELKLES